MLYFRYLIYKINILYSFDSESLRFCNRTSVSRSFILSLYLNQKMTTFSLMVYPSSNWYGSLIECQDLQSSDPGLTDPRYQPPCVPTLTPQSFWRKEKRPRFLLRRSVTRTGLSQCTPTSLLQIKGHQHLGSRGKTDTRSPESVVDLSST